MMFVPNFNNSKSQECAPFPRRQTRSRNAIFSNIRRSIVENLPSISQKASEPYLNEAVQSMCQPVCSTITSYSTQDGQICGLLAIERRANAGSCVCLREVSPCYLSSHFEILYTKFRRAPKRIRELKATRQPPLSANLAAIAPVADIWQCFLQREPGRDTTIAP